MWTGTFSLIKNIKNFKSSVSVISSPGGFFLLVYLAY